MKITRKEEENPKIKKVIKKHDRMTTDNIIKKIKAEFLKFMILFINNVIAKLNLLYNNKIFKIDYDFINYIK